MTKSLAATLLFALPALAVLAEALRRRLPRLGGRRHVWRGRSRHQDLSVSLEGDGLALRAGPWGYRNSALDPAAPFRHVIEYTEMMMVGLGYVEDPGQVLVLGLGGGTVTRYVRRYYPEVRITSVDLDETVVALASSHFGLGDDPLSTVVIDDARRFLERTSERFDLVFLDVYDDEYIPPHLVTREFLELVRKHLKEGGVVVANTWSDTRLFARESATYAAVFGGFDNYRGKRSANRIIVARGDGAQTVKEALRDAMVRVQRRRGFQELDLPTLVEGHLCPEFTWPADAPLLEDPPPAGGSG